MTVWRLRQTPDKRTTSQSFHVFTKSGAIIEEIDCDSNIYFQPAALGHKQTLDDDATECPLWEVWRTLGTDILSAAA